MTVPAAYMCPLPRRWALTSVEVQELEEGLFVEATSSDTLSPLQQLNSPS